MLIFRNYAHGFAVLEKENLICINFQSTEDQDTEIGIRYDDKT